MHGVSIVRTFIHIDVTIQYCATIGDISCMIVMDEGLGVLKCLLLYALWIIETSLILIENTS